jgi:8-oxo-dGTP pyrophosphatase MutT (NUDIX family)
MSFCFSGLNIVLRAEGFTPQEIRMLLERNVPEPMTNKGRSAAVAMILIGPQHAEELLFIQRADYQGDPWSGDVAFPGGGVEAQDADSRATAERETREEIGLVLSDEAYLGMLGSIDGAYLPVRIACHVYQLAHRPQLEPNHEVLEIFYVPLAVLLEAARNQKTTFEYRGTQRTHPIIDLEGYCERFLWGISYRLLQRFFATLGINHLH